MNFRARLSRICAIRRNECSLGSASVRNDPANSDMRNPFT
jgi:hypothetical protein